MRKKNLLLMGVFAFGLLQAQIGINTDNPQALFHIDGASTSATTNPATGAPSASQAVDDVVVTNDGRVGIGLINPEGKLHIRTGGTAAAPAAGFRLKTGSQNLGKVLTAIAADGTADWRDLVVTNIIMGNLHPQGVDIVGNTGYHYTGSTLTLPPGTWLVEISIEINVTNCLDNNPLQYWVTSLFSESNTTAVWSPDVIMGRAQAAQGKRSSNWDMLYGASFIINETGANKTYYYWGRLLPNYNRPDMSFTNFSLSGFGRASNSSIIAAIKLHD
ncbi:hypothetical protein [Dysgonomonas sp. GY617]|uniref:hypothetical protein n=1 Tax=Dysgonomonas sp. GY617 TaxID=2780420 RepID=UPI0018831843|nr:hypothetical protein [Dysgonomonas sp. GY617]MBF0575548.1 hypothetical protein [Dysgonomonas sp. GY617]